MTCPKHPKYKAIRRPTCDCLPCWKMYAERNRKLNKITKILISLGVGILVTAVTIGLLCGVLILAKEYPIQIGIGLIAMVVGVIAVAVYVGLPTGNTND